MAPPFLWEIIMPMILELPSIHERADTDDMRKLLSKLAEAEKSLIETKVGRLMRKMGSDYTHTDVQRLVETAENCGWVQLKTNALGSIKNITLSQTGRDLIGETNLMEK